MASLKFQGRFEELLPGCFYRLVAHRTFAELTEVTVAAIVPSRQRFAGNPARDRFLHDGDTRYRPIFSRSREISGATGNAILFDLSRDKRVR